VFVCVRYHCIAALDQTLLMNNERLAIPELLFRPQDLGIAQAGLPELVQQAIRACPAAVQPGLWANIVLTGGNARIPNLGLRLERELRALAPADWDVCVFVGANPHFTTWHGASRFAIEAEVGKCSVTRAEYDEHGPNLCARRFLSLY